jgi:hypothetical protein
MLITEKRAETILLFSARFSVIIFGPFGSLSVIHFFLTCMFSVLSVLSVGFGT